LKAALEIIKYNFMEKVKVYSTPTCPYCLTIKDFLKDHQVDFEDIDVAEDDRAREEMIKKSGQMGVPVVEIGENVIVGFEKNKILELLGLKG
jgi:glutaredoxin 3